MVMQIHDANIKSIIQVESVYAYTHPVVVVLIAKKKKNKTRTQFN